MRVLSGSPDEVPVSRGGGADRPTRARCAGCARSSRAAGFRAPRGALPGARGHPQRGRLRRRRPRGRVIAVAGALGTVTELPSPARRVVSLVPSVTEAVAMLGGLARLVGRTDYCVAPPAVAALPSVGGTKDGASVDARRGPRPRPRPRQPGGEHRGPLPGARRARRGRPPELPEDGGRRGDAGARPRGARGRRRRGGGGHRGDGARGGGGRARARAAGAGAGVLPDLDGPADDRPRGDLHLRRARPRRGRQRLRRPDAALPSPPTSAALRPGAPSAWGSATCATPG